MALATTQELEGELIERIKMVPAFSGHGYSVFGREDMEAKASELSSSLPIFGVAYDGSWKVGQEAKGGADVHSAAMRVVQFIVVVAIQYRYSGQQDTKVEAQSLLDQARNSVHGFKNVNSRPWVWVSDGPEPEDSSDGIAFYSQVWQTSLPLVGTFNHP